MQKNKTSFAKYISDMMSFLKNLFSKSSKDNLTVVEADRKDIPKFSFDAIKAGNPTALIVRNFLSQETCITIVDNLLQQMKNKDFDLEKKRIFPVSFAEDDEQEFDSFDLAMEHHLSYGPPFLKNFYRNYNYDLPKDLKSCFEQIRDVTQLKEVTGPNQNHFIPATFRVQKPEKVDFKLHCGNQFIDLFPEYFAYLTPKVHVRDQLSYFIMLQEPEKGGRLILYDVSWKQAQICDSKKNTLETVKGKKIFLDTDKSVKRRYLNIKQGDLLVFAAGEFWHEVEQVYGDRNRITYGGIIGNGADNPKEIFWWS